MRKEKLQTIRKQKGYTQQQVADFIATDVSNYSRKENGDVRIFPEEWDRLVRFLDVSMEEIYEEDEERKRNTLKIDRESFYTSIINDLQNYIALLKEEIERLKKQNPTK